MSICQERWGEVQDSNISQRISRCVDRLVAEGAGGAEQYARRLRDNAGNPSVLDDLCFEARAAFMFLRNGFKVTLREKADLRLELGSEVVYAEVKHFRRKKQDRIDEEAMLKATDLLVPIGDTTDTEGVHAWRQIVSVATSKANQYMEGAPNILVIQSGSESLELMLSTACDVYNSELPSKKDPRLRRLNALMLVNTGLVGYARGGPCNVEFCLTKHATISLSAELAEALSGITLG